MQQLSRQIASLLFDRFAKSRDKAGPMQLATRGHEALKPYDTLRDPVGMGIPPAA